LGAGLILSCGRQSFEIGDLCRETDMQPIESRRYVVAALAGGVAGLIGAPMLMTGRSFAEEPPPETTTIRLPKGTLLCNLPQYLADDLLRAEGFTDVQRVPTAGQQPVATLARGELDLTMAYAPSAIMAIDSGAAITLLAGVHVGCNVVFAHEGIRSIRDLKGKKVGANGAANGLLSAMAAYVGLDPQKDIEWVLSSAKEAFIARKVDAFMALPPDPQELRARKIGHEIVNSSLDRPWSQLFCCALAGSREFVRKNPIATKRALRAILRSTDLCVSDPAGSARRMVDGGFTASYDYMLQLLTEAFFNKWRDYDVEDSIRFYALRLREGGMIKSIPNKIIADGTNWRFLNELKRELKA
jgi:NitT/TauT family transport system substrate-binding protein